MNKFTVTRIKENIRKPLYIIFTLKVYNNWMIDKKMNPRNTARLVGVLFITGILATVLSFTFLESLGDPDYLDVISANEGQLMKGVLLELITVLVMIGIPVSLFPILKKHNETLALGFLGLRLIEAINTVIVSIILMSLLTLSQEYVLAGTQGASYYLTTGTVLLAAREGAVLIGLGLFFALSALTLNYVLYQSKLVPRWLSVWGLVGAIMTFSNAMLHLFGIDMGFLPFLPLNLQEIVFAAWLIVKGFNSSETASPSE